MNLKKLTPKQLNHIFYNEFGLCGCAETEAVHATLVKILEWHEKVEDRPPFTELYPEPGIFYILAGLLADFDYAEHGTAIRFPWLTEQGRNLLFSLKSHTPQEIDEAGK